MAIQTEPAAALRAWLAIPETIEMAIDGLSEAELDLRGSADSWSIREFVHHLVEANLVASNIIIAALAKSGCIYDWSWVWPDSAWNQRVGYNTAPVRPALETLRALCEHIAGLIRTTPDGFLRQVREALHEDSHGHSRAGNRACRRASPHRRGNQGGPCTMSH